MFFLLHTLVNILFDHDLEKMWPIKWTPGSTIVQEETDVIVQEETEGRGLVQEETDDYELETLESESDIEQPEELNNYRVFDTRNCS